MKTIFSLILSLLVAAGLCLVLLVTGVLKYDGGCAKANIGVAAERMASRVAKTLEDMPNTLKHSFSPTTEKVTAKHTPPDRLPTVLTRQEPVPNGEKGAGSAREDLVYERSLEFLKSIVDKGRANIEDQFTNFLKKDLGADEEEAARFVRMSFWKNFVTLQDSWLPGEKHKMDIAFMKEKELKKAGFAAKGLTLMTGEIEEAENRLREIGTRLSSSTTGEKKL